MKKIIIILALSLSISGCSSTKAVRVDSPVQPAKEGKMVSAIPTSTPAIPTYTPTEKFDSYTVKKGDCLWNISKKSEIYNTPWLWTLIYRYNRESINNPNLIYPAQVLRIKHLGVTFNEISEAVKEAEDFK